ncbi:MAG: neutral/alkaline non-lysosomal ceramidase N-terminal domain-containing protein [Planctomycetota bacterium]
MKIGFAKVDITPRVGVELCGFGAFRLRRSIGVRDRLWAKAMAVEHEGVRAVIVSCDLIGVPLSMTADVRRLVREGVGMPADAVMVHCTHTHSGPGMGTYIGWGEADAPYLELLPGRIARACCEAAADLRPAALLHAQVPCAGVGYNREYDKTPPMEEALKDDYRPAKPELTDTTCHVLKVERDGRMDGFLAYFGCHPVVCCAETRYIHGDYCGVAMNLLEGERPGSVGLFLQGAQGDVNSCVVHKPEAESLRALDVIASRFARAVRHGIEAAQPVEVDSVACVRRDVTFSRKDWGRENFTDLLAREEAVIHAPEASQEDGNVRLSVVRAIALRRLIKALDAGESLQPPSEVQGLRLGPIALLGGPFEIFQAIKNEVVAKARAPIPLVMGITNDAIGYAVDRAKAAQGGYAADLVPLICGALPFADTHGELVAALLEIDATLFA